MKISLARPFKYEDYEITEINLDFDKVSTQVLVDLDREMTKRRYVPQMKQTDSLYCLALAARISDYSLDILLRLPLRYGNLINNAVSLFLLNSEEPDSESTETTT